ncbi:MAG: NAD(+) synthase [Thermacetogeniaceae bacterium]
MTGLENLQAEMEIDCAAVASLLTQFIAAKMEELEREGVILGLSGGIDSAVVAALCQRAVGPDRVLALVMPEKDSRKENFHDALTLAEDLGINARVIDLTNWLKELDAYHLFPLTKFPLFGKLQEGIMKAAYSYYRKKTGETPFSSSLLGFRDKDFASYLKTGNAYYRLKHRLRMVLLYLYGELENRLVVGCANKTEYKIGFFVKHGCDDAADIMPLLDLYKTQVKALAQHLGIPERIIEKAPSPDILPGINDEDAIGLSYKELDLILLGMEKGWSEAEISYTIGIKKEKVEYVKSLIQKSDHMRQTYFPKIHNN